MRTIRGILWHPVSRLLLFWGLFCAVLVGIDKAFSDVNFILLGKRILLATDLAQGKLSEAGIEPALRQLSGTDFIFSLAYGVVSVAAAFALAFMICHVVVLAVSLWEARRIVNRHSTPEAFFAAYDSDIYHKLKSHPLLGASWREFGETLVAPKEYDLQIFRNTVRPQSFINIGLAREKLVGLKMLSSIPGYFVAVGLLLTFAGIVLALYKAGEASGAEDVTVMQHAMTELLQIASFKFATSIAGLACSLFLSIVFKLYTIWIEMSFNSFCEAVEEKLNYIPPQSQTNEIREVLQDQRDQLKEINSEKFHLQLGQAISPQIHTAFAEAMVPVNQSISSALDRVTESSQSGVTDMLKEFSNNVQGSAGTELRELAGTLATMQQTLADMQGGVRNSGEDFARRMSEAAENLNSLVRDAAQSMNDGAASNRDNLKEMVAALQATFERANSALDEDLGKAASGASVKIEEAMGRVMEKLEGQVGHLSDGLNSLGGNLSSSIEETQKSIAEAQQSAASTVTEVAASAAEALKTGLAETLQRIRDEIERFEAALENSRSALSSQANAIGNASSQTRQVADVFSKTATELRNATTPFTQSANQIAQTTNSFKSSLNEAVEALQKSQAGSSELAVSLKENGEKLISMWDAYENRFQRIDEELGRAVETLSNATIQQGDTLSRYASEVDQSLAQAVTQLNSGVSDIGDSVEEFGQEVEKLRTALRPAAE